MKAILYINQFFGQIGGEEFAGHEPEIRETNYIESSKN